jgi:hypothetical protein
LIETYLKLGATELEWKVLVNSDAHCARKNQIFLYNCPYDAKTVTIILGVTKWIID